MRRFEIRTSRFVIRLPMVSQLLDKVKERKADLYTALIIFLVGMASFGLGRLSAAWKEKEPVTLTSPSPESVADSRTATPETGNPGSKEGTAAAINALPPATPSFDAQGKYVASKSGTAYHFPWCPGALRIKEANKVWFDTKEEAEKKGYKPAANCPGL